LGKGEERGKDKSAGTRSSLPENRLKGVGLPKNYRKGKYEIISGTTYVLNKKEAQDVDKRRDRRDLERESSQANQKMHRGQGGSGRTHKEGLGEKKRREGNTCHGKTDWTIKEGARHW